MRVLSRFRHHPAGTAPVHRTSPGNVENRSGHQSGDHPPELRSPKIR
ncbi:hypothetical protein AVEN_24883-1, partial [Araneus ventricosus]